MMALPLKAIAPPAANNRPDKAGRWECGINKWFFTGENASLCAGFDPACHKRSVPLGHVVT